MPDREELLRRQRALGDFGEFVLDNDDLQKILDEACRLITEALGAEYAKIVEIDHKSSTGLIRAGVGWRPGIVGNERVDLHERSSEAFAIEKTQPVVTQDIAEEERFEFPAFTGSLARRRFSDGVRTRLPASRHGCCSLRLTRRRVSRSGSSLPPAEKAPPRTCAGT
jgi:hypothetical protein